MSEKSSAEPYQALGRYLKTMRQKSQESLGETSGAVEIDAEKLESYERGVEVPAEDILLLLINHFGLPDDEAVGLWQLAGYDPQPPEPPRGNQPAGHPMLVMMALDGRILYSDSAHIAADKNGVVFNFLQNGNLDGKNRHIPISRVGMSYNQAHDFLRILGQTLQQAETLRRPKQLPAPKNRNQTNDKPHNKDAS